MYVVGQIFFSLILSFYRNRKYLKRFRNEEWISFVETTNFLVKMTNFLKSCSCLNLHSKSAIWSGSKPWCLELNVNVDLEWRLRNEHDLEKFVVFLKALMSDCPLQFISSVSKQENWILNLWKSYLKFTSFPHIFGFNLSSRLFISLVSFKVPFFYSEFWFQYRKIGFNLWKSHL